MGAKWREPVCLTYLVFLEFRDAILQNYLFIYLKLFIHLFLALVGLCSCVQAFSSCSEQGLLSSCGAQVSHCGGFSCFGARLLGSGAFRSCSTRAYQLWARGLQSVESTVVAHGLSCATHMETSQTTDRTCVPCRWILNSLDHEGSPAELFMSDAVAMSVCQGPIQCTTHRVVQTTEPICFHSSGGWRSVIKLSISSFLLMSLSWLVDDYLLSEFSRGLVL